MQDVLLHRRPYTLCGHFVFDIGKLQKLPTIKRNGKKVVLMQRSSLRTDELSMDGGYFDSYFLFELI